ncbi:hypothetical protein GGF46_000478 [Coemansia sp. RSA 552]|nr:hypothetical protein GGF46_000478 [Coemansia sp. RSA 552]
MPATRIDVLEAENRVLRLKNEQDKAHITASQMLARDLAANGTPSPPARGAFGLSNAPISPSVSLQQLSSARDALEQERKESRARIEQLEAQISELQAAGQDTGHDAPDPSKEEQTVVELREELTRTAEAHSKELDATASARSELAASLEQRAAEIEQLQAELDAKASEIDGLNGRLEERSLELSRATQRYRDLMDEQHASGPEESDPQPALEKQVGQLRHDLAESEEKLQRLAAAAATTTTTTADQSTAERDSARVLIARCRSHLSELITAMQPANDEASEDTLGDDSDGPDSKINPALFAKSRELASQLTERVGNAAERIESLDSELQAKDDLIAELRRELAALKEEQGAAPEAQARVEELESLNDRLVEERNQFIDEQASVNEYLEKLEAESHRLIEDIEQLTAENQKLTEELRAASLQNSAVSLDVGAVDSMLATEQSSSADVDGYADTAPEAAGDSSSDAGAAAVRRQLAELEKRKNAEIKSLEDELGSLETMVENMTFTESELNDKIASLTDEVDRLRHMHPAAGAGARARVAEPIIEEAAPDPEQSPCDVCGSADHSIDACPQVNAMPASLFKQDAPVDSSRPYCDNCESFGLHWTLDCPHDDEMF